MKKNTHPTYYKESKIRCACGNAFAIGSTKPEINVEICSKCHPFYTGKAKIIDVAGRVERFKARHAKKVKTPIRKKHEKKTKKAVKKQKKAK